MPDMRSKDTKYIRNLKQREFLVALQISWRWRKLFWALVNVYIWVGLEEQEQHFKGLII